MFISPWDSILSEIGTKLVRQILYSPLTIVLNAKQKRHIGKFVLLTGLHYIGVIFRGLKRRRYLQVVLATNQKLFTYLYKNVTILTSFEALTFLHSIVVLNNSSLQWSANCSSVYKRYAEWLAN